MSCPDCFRGFIHGGEPRGRDETLACVPCYYSPPLAGASAKLPTILFLTDVFGHTFVNARLLADTYADGGFHVFVPDLFKGDALDPRTLDFMEAEGTLAAFAVPFKLLCALPTLFSFIRRHGEAATMPTVLAVAAALRERADAAGTPLFVVSFCFGGPYAARLARPAAPGAAPLAEAVVLAHPSNLTPVAAAAIDVPALYCLVPRDMFTPKSAAAAKDAQRARGAVEANVEVYLGVGHGFAVRGGPSTVSARKRCAEDVLRFLKGVCEKK
jgi:dienelactone hydrolase